MRWQPKAGKFNDCTARRRSGLSRDCKHLGFWHLIRKTLVDALNYSHQHGELSGSQNKHYTAHPRRPRGS